MRKQQVYQHLFLSGGTNFWSGAAFLRPRRCFLLLCHNSLSSGRAVQILNFCTRVSAVFSQVHIYYRCLTIWLQHSYISCVLAPPPSTMLSRFNPSCQLSTSQPLSEMRERTRRVKLRKLMDWDEDSLIGKAKATGTSKTTQEVNLPLPMGRQMFNHHMSLWLRKANAIYSNVPTSFFFPQLHILTMMSNGMMHPWSQFYSDFLAMSLPSTLCIPSPLTNEVAWGAEKVLTLC